MQLGVQFIRLMNTLYNTTIFTQQKNKVACRSRNVDGDHLNREAKKLFKNEQHIIKYKKKLRTTKKNIWWHDNRFEVNWPPEPTLVLCWISKFLSPSGDLGIGLVWDNNPTGPDSFLVRLLKSSSNWTKLSMMVLSCSQDDIRWFSD